MKMCPKCKIGKLENEFHKNRGRKDGLCWRCKSCINEKQKLYRKANSDKERQYGQKYYEQNKSQIIHRNGSSQKDRYWIDPKFRLSTCFRTSMYHSLKGNKNGRHWETLVGYTLNELKIHLEKLFQKGMNWANYGKRGWVIDHKLPIAAFNFEKSEDIDFQRCWALKNLRPLWAHQNAKKHNSLQGSFQPAMIF